MYSSADRNKIVFILAILFCFTAFADAQKEWTSLFEAGMTYLEENRFDEAERQFREILDQDKKASEGYLGLGMLYNKKDPGSRKAERNIKKAIRLDNRNGEAYYHLAMVYKNMSHRLFEVRESLEIAVVKDPSLIDAWFELGKVEETLWPYTGVVNIYRRGVKRSPEAWPLFEHFVNAGLWHGNRKKVISTIEYLVKQYPDHSEYRYALAEVYQRLGLYDQSLKTVEEMEIRFPGYSASKINLIKAKVYFEIDKMAEGLVCYEAALDSLKTSSEDEAFFKDLCYLMTDREFEKYQSAGEAGKKQFYEQFWRSRDPNLATSANERIPEHYQRLTYARRKFLGYLPAYKKPEEKYIVRHPYVPYNIQGEAFLSASYIPKAIDRPRDLDDMGIIFIRHGLPQQEYRSYTGMPDWLSEIKLHGEMRKHDRSSRLVVPRPTDGENLMASGFFDNIPLNKSWRYAARDNRPELIFHFKKYERKTSWIMESVPYAVVNRELLDPKYQALLKESFSDFPNTEIVKEACVGITHDNKQFVEIALKTETSNYAYADKQLPVSVDVAAFKGADGHTQMEIFYGINGKDIRLAKSGQDYFVNAEKFIGLYDDDWNEIVRISKEDTIAVNVRPSTWKSSAFLDIEQFDVPPGDYRYELQFRDKTGASLGVFKGRYQIPDYMGETLQISDVLLSGAITPNDHTSKFHKGNIQYKPHMFADYRTHEIIGLYFEMYNLGLDQNNKSDFQITCTRTAEGGNDDAAGKVVHGFYNRATADAGGIVDSVYAYQGDLKNEKIYLYFDAAELRAGKHLLKIEALDLQGNSRAAREVEIRMQ